MAKSRILCSLFLSHCLLTGLQGDEVSCGKGPRPSRVTMRHIEANGIGYNQGYTTLEGFFSPNAPYRTSWVPFLDLRGHVFNTGKFAANAGVGLRYLTDRRIWGANAYYDYRNTHHQHYNQIALGFETLGQRWDARINGYLPVGRKTSSLHRTKFSYFAGNSLYLSQKQQVALKGVNAEVGGHVNRYKHFPLYFTAGPYYLGARGINAWGGQVRAVCDVYEYFRLEGNVSYDNEFRWRGQGQASVIVPFGPRRAIKAEDENSCPQALALSERAVQRVDRFEIIPVKSHRVKSVAIDPLTKEPWVFWFVDNTSSSDGTFESPFPTLVQAQNASAPYNAIYVFPGDGTASGMDAGITLQNFQRLLGASVAHPLPTTKGFVTIPSMASSLPNITNMTSDVVTLGSNNTVSGFIITAAVADKNGLAGRGIENLFAFQNQFETFDTTTNGIGLLNPSGIVLVGDSTFRGFNCNDATVNGNGIYVKLDAGSSLKTLSVTGSAFSDMNNLNPGSGGNGISVQLAGGSLGSLNVASSTFDKMNGPGCILANLTGNATLSSFNVTSCSFDDLVGFPVAGISATLAGSSRLTNFNVTACSFNNLLPAPGIFVALFDNSILSNLNASSITATNLDGSFGFVYAQLHNHSILSNMNVSSCKASYLFDALGISAELHDNSTLSNMNVVSISFSNTGYISTPIIATVEDSSTLSNMNVSSCDFNGMLYSFPIQGIFQGGTIENFNVSSCTFRNQDEVNCIELSLNSGALGNVDVSSCLFSSLSNTNGVLINVTGGSLGNAEISSCSFADMDESAAITITVAGSTVGNVNVSSCTFSDINLSESVAVTASGGIMNSFNMNSCSFSTLNQATGINLSIEPGGTLQSVTVSDTAFTDVVSNVAISVGMAAATSTNLKMVNNTFAGRSSSPKGWGATIDVSNGTACLEFLDNSAMAAFNPVPYLFEQSGGTFNRTTGSDNTTNIGQITVTGTVGAPGSCTQ